MKRITQLTVALLVPVAALFVASPSAEAAILIDGSGITATASNEWTTDFVAQNTVNGSGLTDGAHSNAGAGAVWMSSEDADVAWIQWDLGDLYVLDGIHVWNMNMDNQAGSAIWQTDIYVSAEAAPGDPEDAGAANWNQIGANVVFPVPPNDGGNGTFDGYLGFDLETQVGDILPSSAVRFVRFEINTKWAQNPDSTVTNQFGRTADFPGLSEIQFAIPEPASLALLGLGGLLIAGRPKR